MTLNRISNYPKIVAIGGGHGLGRVMSALSFLGQHLTGIVATTDNGGSTGRIRLSEGGIAWGDIRNCINQLITEPSIASAMFEYRFAGLGELSGHNLGNLMLKALDNMSVRPLEAINLIKTLLKVDAQLIPMSEQPSDLVAIDDNNQWIYGEVNVDKLISMPQKLLLEPPVTCTLEAIYCIEQADFILIGPGSFMTSLIPPLLLNGIASALINNPAPIIYIDNLVQELCPAASSLKLIEKILLLEQTLKGRQIDAVIVAPHTDITGTKARLIIQQVLADQQVPYRHDRQLLKRAINVAINTLRPDWSAN